jgi:hypothetical protein
MHRRRRGRVFLRGQARADTGHGRRDGDARLAAGGRRRGRDAAVRPAHLAGCGDRRVPRQLHHRRADRCRLLHRHRQSAGGGGRRAAPPSWQGIPCIARAYTGRRRLHAPRRRHRSCRGRDDRRRGSPRVRGRAGERSARRMVHVVGRRRHGHPPRRASDPHLVHATAAGSPARAARGSSCVGRRHGRGQLPHLRRASRGPCHRAARVRGVSARRSCTWRFRC